MTEHSPSDNLVRVGLFLPAKQQGVPASIHNPGYINEATRVRLVERLSEDPRISLSPNVDFRREVVFNGGIDLGLDVLLWHAQLDRGPSSFHIEVLEAIARRTTVINDPRRYRVGIDKYLAHTALKEAGLPVPEFALFANDPHSYERLVPLLEQWGALLIKPRLGAYGQGIVKITDPSTLRDVVAYTRGFGSGIMNVAGGETPILVERFYENDPSEWISVTVIGGEVMYGYRKRPEKFVDGRVLDGMGIGGGVDYVNPSDEEREIALHAAGVMGLDIVGFDMIKTSTSGTPFIVDENTGPGLYPNCFEQAGINLADQLYQVLDREITKVVQEKGLHE